MAQTQRPLFFQFLLTLTLFSFSNPTSLGYSLCQQKQQKQQCQVVNGRPQSTTLTAATTLTNSSVLSLPENQLDSIKCPKDQNYLALTNSRLKLQLPVTEESYHHRARVGIGQPVKEFYLRLDTGSDINWLQCLPCDECYNQSDPIFDPSQSSSYHPLSCTSQQCTSLRFDWCSSANTCIYDVNYRDNSSSIGDFATETWSFDNSGSVDSVAFGCGHLNRNQGLRRFAGIIGLGGGVLSLPSQIKATSFSYCLVDINSTSSSTLDFNSTPPDDSLIVPFITNPKNDVFYYVELTGIIIEGEQVSIPPSVFQIGNNGNGGIIVDSGNMVSRLKTQVYNSVRATFLKYSLNLTQSPTGYTSGNTTLLDTCFNLHPNSTVPTMSFQFSGGKTLPLNRKNYLLYINPEMTCLAFVPTSDDFSIIGSIQQIGMRVTYDLANKWIGFSPNKC